MDDSQTKIISCLKFSTMVNFLPMVKKIKFRYKKLLVTRRDILKMTRTQFARELVKLGLSKSCGLTTVKAWESGTMPKLPAVIAICKLTGLKIEDLFDGVV